MHIFTKLWFPAGFCPGNFVRVLSGPHLGLCGKVGIYKVQYGSYIDYKSSSILTFRLCRQMRITVVLLLKWPLMDRYIQYREWKIIIHTQLALSSGLPYLHT